MLCSVYALPCLFFFAPKIYFSYRSSILQIMTMRGGPYGINYLSPRLLCPMFLSWLWVTSMWLSLWMVDLISFRVCHGLLPLLTSKPTFMILIWWIFLILVILSLGPIKDPLVLVLKSWIYSLCIFVGFKNFLRSMLSSLPLHSLIIVLDDY